MITWKIERKETDPARLGRGVKSEWCHVQTCLDEESAQKAIRYWRKVSKNPVRLVKITEEIQPTRKTK